MHYVHLKGAVEQTSHALFTVCQHFARAGALGQRDDVLLHGVVLFRRVFASQGLWEDASRDLSAGLRADPNDVRYATERGCTFVHV